MWYTQDINKLFRTDEFMREYGECEFGPKCPNHPTHLRDSPRKYKDRSLLSADYPIQGLQDAINKYQLEKECSYTFFESGFDHLGTRAFDDDLNITSLPWILCAV